MKLEDHVALITGGGSGIGLELARALLERGNTVIAAGRDPARLARAQAAAPGLHVFACDITNPGRTSAMLARVVADFGRLTILVNNAGVLNQLDLLAGVDPDLVEHEVATDFVAPVKLTLQALPLLVREPAAAVVNVTGGVAFAPIAALPVYCAAKAALHSFTRSLRHQLVGTDVKVFEVMPPGTATALSRSVKTPRTPVEEVVRAAVRGIERDRFEIVIGDWKKVRLMQRLAPRLVEDKVLRLED